MDEARMTEDPKTVALGVIESSGDAFHTNVLQRFRALGWYSLVSPYYMDATTNKPREIDLVVESARNYPQRYNRPYGSINTRLYVECKYVPEDQQIVFWFDNQDLISTDLLLTSTLPFRNRNVIMNQHHYKSSEPRVAKLFRSNRGQRDSRIESELMYKALNQCLHAKIYHHLHETIVRDANFRPENILETAEYPVIVLNSFEGLWRVDVEDQSNPVPIEDHFKLEVNYAYVDDRGNRRNDYFLIDVVDFRTMETYLELFGRDSDAIAEMLS